MSNIEIHGVCDERFEPVKKAFEENFKDGLDVGASLAVTLNGEYVVDLWAGYADAQKTRPWEKDTIINVFSTTKVMTSICALMLVDSGLLDLEAPVAQYWPEFAQSGKDKLPVRYLFSHSSGLSGFSKDFPYETLYDWDRIVSILAAQKPFWEPGTKSVYHMLTYGYLLGELIRRITGKTIGTFFKDEIATPLNADFHIGLPEENFPRVAHLIAPKISLLIKILSSKIFQKLFSFSLIMKTVRPTGIISGDVDEVNSRAWRQAEIPAANGHGNARSIARVGAVIACGGKLDNLQLLSESILEKALEQQTYNKCPILRSPVRWGLGFALPTKELTFQFPNPRTLFWGGLGGSFCFMDLDAKISCGYAMNNMSASILGDERWKRFTLAYNEILKNL